MESEAGLVVTGSEIVGLIPFQAIYQAGRYYLEKQGISTGVPIKDIINTAIYSMGFNDVSFFKPEEKIIGLPKTDSGDLVSLSTANFVHEVSRESPAPGGGSVAALAGSLGAALTSMVSNLTIGKKDYEGVWGELTEIADRVQEIKDQLIKAVDDDTNAFNAFMEACRLPQNSEQENINREKAIQEGLKEAVSVPLNTANLSFEALKLAKRVLEIGNKNSATDVAVGAQIAFTGLRGGIFNVLINLPQITDENYINSMRHTCVKLQKEGEDLLKDSIEIIEKIFNHILE